MKQSLSYRSLQKTVVFLNKAIPISKFFIFLLLIIHLYQNEKISIRLPLAFSHRFK
jgi:hypothetical protein